MSSPTVDDRTQAELVAELTELADQYVDGWEPESEDMASAVLEVGSAFGADLIQQLNRLPQKHRAALFETLGVTRRPPQAARLPLSVSVSTHLDHNVTVPGGTQAIATTADDETEPFEIPPERGFEATPASLSECYAVDPDSDLIVSHAGLTEGDSETLFVGSNQQQHAIYLGDDSLFRLDPGSVIEVDLRGSVDAEALTTHGRWEYYGADEEGSEGWHSLPIDDDPDPRVGVESDSLGLRLDRRSASTQSTDSGYSIRLRLPGACVPTTVADTESRWIRCRLETATPACFDTEIESIRVRVDHSTETDHITPDAGFATDVPLALGDESAVRPFGRRPQPSSTMYLSSAAVFTKPGAIATLTFHPPADDSITDTGRAVDDLNTASETDRLQAADFGALGGPPEISWEYWNGSGWAGLPVRADDTDCLRTAGEVRFEVPDDIEPTAVSGTESRWIRARLVGGSYGQPPGSATDSPGDTVVGAPDAPQYSYISLGYDHAPTAVDHVATENNGVSKTVPRPVDRYWPFSRLPESHQTLYVGFDAVLCEGPIPLFIPLADTGSPRAFDPGIQWEYCVDPETDSWSALPVEDGTAGLTERGVVSLRFPEPTTAHERFGTRCHWIRAVVTGDSFITDQSAVPADSQPPTGLSTDSAGAPPTISGMFPNTQWADNVRTIRDEILGSSDGSANQTFRCAHEPLIDCALWVDEAGSLSAAERDDLEATAPDRVETVVDDHGTLVECWVRWTPVETFAGVGRDERAYRLDRSAGTITFGDGERGSIPPHGRDTIRATYTTGGGAAGNVDAGAIQDLKTPISLVESVDNPLPAAGGTGVESVEAAAARAASERKTRRRAVTPADFEQIAATAVRNLATVTCTPHLGPDGDRNPGWVTLLIVPDTDSERPTPSRELLHRVHQAVSEAAPARLTDGDQPRIVVRGPTYASVSVEATVRSTEFRSLSEHKRTIESALSAYLHPLTGGPDGTGWSFGEPPTVEGLESCLRSIETVEAVTELSATVEFGNQRVRLRRGRPPTFPVDGLVCAGTHDSTVQVGDRR